MKLRRPFHTRVRRFWQETEGLYAVEMAIAFPILLLCLCGLIDFGNLYAQSNLVSNAAATGAQIAANSKNGSGNWTNLTLQTKIQSAYDNNNLTVNVSYDASTPPNVTVTVSIPTNPIITGKVLNYFDFGSLPSTVSQSCTMVTEY